MLFDKDTSAPKRARYYGDQVDVQLLETSVDYEKLPEQVTIFILSYDPFGKDFFWKSKGKSNCSEPSGYRTVTLFLH